MPNPVAVISEQITLANLYAQKQDYASAEPILQASIATTRSDAVTQEQRIIIRSTYARILRQLHKDAEADALEKSLQMPEPTADEQLPVPVASDPKAPTATVSGEISPVENQASSSKSQQGSTP
jgi:hypothetical protein